jgi:hypothetical protein
VIRGRLRAQVRNNTASRTDVTLGYLLGQWLAGHQVEAMTRATYRRLIDSFIRPASGNTPISRLGPHPFEKL